MTPKKPTAAQQRAKTAERVEQIGKRNDEKPLPPNVDVFYRGRLKVVRMK